MLHITRAIPIPHGTENSIKKLLEERYFKKPIQRPKSADEVPTNHARVTTKCDIR